MQYSRGCIGTNMSAHKILTMSDLFRSPEDYWAEVGGGVCPHECSKLSAKGPYVAYSWEQTNEDILK